ncbi:MAG: hypothetical protein FJX57_07990 [Alphaproteobacteria bacterium]|nr:hypothetical protein [Alphaproteobacteria bacterium]
MPACLVPRSVIDAGMRIAGGAIAVAGGTAVVPTLTAGDAFVPLRRLPDLSRLIVEPGRILLGATTTLAAVAALDAGGEALGALRDAAAAVGNPHIRRMATIGGNLGWVAQPTDLEVALLALDAEIELVVDGRRMRVAIGEARELVRTRRALITAVVVPIEPGIRSAFVKLTTRRASSAAFASVAVAGRPGLVDLRVALGGLGADAQRCPTAEASAGGSVATLAATAARGARITRGAEAFRRRAVHALVERAVARLGAAA